MMMSVEEYMEYLKTDEGKRKIKELAEEMRKEEERKKALVQNDSYFKWLEEFTKEHPNFDDQEWLYSPEEISEEDNENVKLLCDLFTVIDNYAEANYIYPTPCDYGTYYSIEYNGKVYEIGLIVGQGALTFCNTRDINKDAAVIYFEEIANPTEITLKRTKIIQKELDKIDVLFRELLERKIPIDAIVSRADKVLKEFEKTEK